MAIAVYCDKCGSGLEDFGGLAFGPPQSTGIEPLVVKYHLCVKCWVEFMHWLFPTKSKS